jgi:hypothetical protein
MIPNNIRRTITVNSEKWEYCVTGRYCATIFIHNLKTNEKIHWHIEEDNIKIGPADIKKLIETKELLGIKAKNK